MDKLKPCPFCATSDQDRFLQVKPFGRRSRVVCDACSAEGPAMSTEDGAREAWNRRTEGETVMADGGPATESETEYVEYLKRIGRREGRAQMAREVREAIKIHCFRTIHACKPLNVVGADALLLALEKLEGGEK